MRRSDFNYTLPQDLIAQHPSGKRGESRLLCLEGDTGELVDRQFGDLNTLLAPGDLLVFNDTKVMPARLFGSKETGGRVELLVERLLDAGRALVHIRASKPPKPGSRVITEQGRVLEILARRDDLFEIVSPQLDLPDLMQAEGHMPLPPYIKREDAAQDRERYQTIYAQRPGAVAAPTAGLHFNQEMLEELRSRGIASSFVTLHVGAGTFQPVRTEDLEEHRMHSEYIEISADTCAKVQDTRQRGGRVVAVGTTSVRCLETASTGGELAPFKGDTNLFIHPGYRFKSVDALITNFHLPESTLLMLVCAFGGYESVMRAYGHAIAEGYRFFSYGDAMFLTGVKYPG